MVPVCVPIHLVLVAIALFLQILMEPECAVIVVAPLLIPVGDLPYVAVLATLVLVPVPVLTAQALVHAVAVATPLVLAVALVYVVIALHQLAVVVLLVVIRAALALVPTVVVASAVVPVVAVDLAVEEAPVAVAAEVAHVHANAMLW